MIMDKDLQLADNLAILGAAVTSNVLDLGATVEAIENPTLIINVKTAFAGGTSVKTDLITATDAAFTTPITLASYTKTTAELNSNPRAVQQKLPWGLKRFVKLVFTPAGTFTAGAVSANIAYGPEIGPAGE
jgi:hypothetical protein